VAISAVHTHRSATSGPTYLPPDRVVPAYPAAITAAVVTSTVQLDFGGEIWRGGAYAALPTSWQQPHKNTSRLETVTDRMAMCPKF